VIAILTLLLMLSLIAQGGFNLSPVISPDTAGETLLLYSLSTLIFLAFITLFFVLLRNVLKLVRERRARRLGSKFKARLVSYSIGLSLLPVLLLFFFAFGLLNRSIDRWFGAPTRQIVEDSHLLEESYLKREEGELASLARAIARSLSLDSRGDIGSARFEADMRREMADYDLALTRTLFNGRKLTFQRGDKRVEPDIEETLSEGERQIAAGAESFTGQDDGESPSDIYAIAAVKAGTHPGASPVLIVAREFPRAVNIDEHYKKIENLRQKLKPLKDTYIQILALVALLLIFATVWLALYVARGITVPIQALAEATDRVAHGDFSHKVEVLADDELAVLVNSFNQMASQLADSREKLELTAEDLQRTNLELYDRRRYIEAVLESLSTGVISIDDRSCINTINPAALRMLGIVEKPSPGTPIGGIVATQQGQEIDALCRRARRAGKSHAEIEFSRADGSSLHAATTAIAQRNSEGTVGGWVLVIEDLTDLVQAERAAAWSEVARRMAHEIKNPLTPIQLSAERIIRNYNRGGATDGPRFDQIVKEGTSTIVREVGALQRMVEEFSRFARLPEALPIETNLNGVIEDAIKLYADRLDGISLESDLAPELPPVRIDPEQIKQVMVNLIDNAIEASIERGVLNAECGVDSNAEVGVRKDAAVGGNGQHAQAPVTNRCIKIQSCYNPESDTARLSVSDNGHGIRPADRDKLFLPKFSTRDRGTGLGLAIVSHIISDHKGRIWVEDNQPQGARFIVELPTA
jgi:two-component system nitrogen regulation sensor histidine kinase NtrY